jgi:hypothetical protein
LKKSLFFKRDFAILPTIVGLSNYHQREMAFDQDNGCDQEEHKKKHPNTRAFKWLRGCNKRKEFLA